MNIVNKSPSRKSTRLKQYDYSTAGEYFITICVQDGRCCLGGVSDDIFVPSKVGLIVGLIWDETFNVFRDVTQTGPIVIMPNHIHACVELLADGGISLGKIVRYFKALSVRQVRIQADSVFAWQRNYYDHVIRNEKDRHRVYEYIENNPLQWALDAENPEVVACRAP
ncbi:MAG: transposase [Candidatus Omnitrophica bacterium]|nr:transposase [Candidatus Omnitrophota bacterium]